MPWAIDGRIGHDPIEGGIEISAEIYGELLNGMLDGKAVTIAGGTAAAIDPPAPEDPEQEPPELTADLAKQTIIAAIDAGTSAILNAYPRAERLGWDAKAAEAQAVIAAGNGATLELAPLLTIECAAESGVASDALRLTQVKVKAAAVLAKAAARGELMATLSGIRAKAFAAMDNASDAESLQAALDAGLEAVAAVAQ